MKLKHKHGRTGIKNRNKLYRNGEFERGKRVGFLQGYLAGQSSSDNFLRSLLNERNAGEARRKIQAHLNK